MTTNRTTIASISQAPSVSDGRGSSRITRLALAISTALSPVWALADTLPTGGTVVHGSAQISNPAPNAMTINQSSDRAVVNWNGFSIGQDSRVDIHQPTANSAILNRVTGDATSQIHGQLNANGRVFVVNPNGILIGPTGNVNTGSFVASTLGIRTDDFVTGKTVFEGNGSSATVENAGNVQVVTGGYAALIGGKVKNSGTIQAPLGFVGLGSGERVTLDLAGDGFLQVALPTNTDDDDVEALIENSGTIRANGGTVQISAATARNAARHAINLSGVVEARTVSGRNGRITLGGGGGGKVTVSGKVRTKSRPAIQVTESARPALRPERGGEITITGRDIRLSGAEIDANGAGGGGDIRIGGEFQGGPGLPTAETLTVDAGTTIKADALTAGDGGRVILWSDVDTRFSGEISAKGGEEGGNGGFVEVSGKDRLTYRGLADVRAPNGAWGDVLLDPSDVEIVAAAPGQNQILNTDLQTQLNSGNVTVATDGGGDLPNSFTDLSEPGTITVDAPINWNAATLLTLDADADVYVNAPITSASGDLTIIAGNGLFSAANAVQINDSVSLSTGTFTINAQGTSPITTGAGGNVDVGAFRLAQGNWRQNSTTLPTFLADNFTLASGTSFLRVLAGDGSSTPYEVTDVFGLQGIGTISMGVDDWVLANDIDAGTTSTWVGSSPASNGTLDRGFVPLDFSGSLDGQRYTISNLFIRQFEETSGATNAGLFDRLSGTVDEVSFVGADVGGTTVGVVAGFNEGTITGVEVSGSVIVYGSAGGGIAGRMDDGSVISSISNVAITDADDPSLMSPGPTANIIVGGIAGDVAGGASLIDQSKSTGSIIVDDFSGDASVGGIVGFLSGDVENSYNESSVRVIGGDGSLIEAGGISGDNNGVIENTLSVGSVSAIGDSVSIGAVVGNDDLSNTSIRNSFFNPTTTGQIISGQIGEVDGGGGSFDGARSRTTTELNDAATFYSEASAAGWDFGSIWSLPQDGSDQTRLYTIDNVISAFGPTPSPEFVYNGTTTGFSATGSYSGGPSAFLFGPLGDGGMLSDMNSQITLSDANVGPVTYRFPTSFTSNQGQTYDVRSLNLPGTVTPAPLLVTVGSAFKPFGTDLAFADVPFTASTLFGSDAITSADVISSGAPASASPGEYSLNLANISGPGISNYSPTFVPGNLRVAPLLDITINDASKTYGDTLTFTGTEFTSIGLLSGDTLTSLTITSDGAAAEAQVADGPFAINGSDPVGTGLENYAISIIPGVLTIIPAPLTITADDQTRPFGAEFTFAGNEFTVSGLLNSDTIDSATLVSDGTDPTLGPTGEAGVAIVITDPQGTGVDNYQITLVNGIFVIAPGDLIITANDQTKTYGETFTFDGTEFTVIGLAEGDSVDSVTLTSAGAAGTAQVGDSPFDIEPSNAVGTGLDKYTLVFEDGSFVVVPAPLTVTADDQVKQEGLLFTFDGTEFTTAGLLNGDTVASAVLSSDGAAAEALKDDSPFAIVVGDVSGTGLDNYEISRVDGTFEVLDIITPPQVNPIPGVTTLPNPTDSITLLLPGSDGPGRLSGIGGPQQTLGDAQATFTVVDALSTDLELSVQSCGNADQDFTNYMACLSESLDTYANALDQIANNLPAGFETVSATIRTASDGVRAAAARAERRLAGATSEAERRAIRAEALAEARGAIAEAQTEIRKAISLIRADDPEVAAVQRETGARIIQAFDTIDSELARAVEL